VRYDKLSVAKQTVYASIVKKEYSFDPLQINKLIYEGGKTLRSIELHWKGTFTNKEDNWELLISDNSQKLPITIHSQIKSGQLKGQHSFVGFVEIKNDKALTMKINSIQSLK